MNIKYIFNARYCNLLSCVWLYIKVISPCQNSGLLVRDNRVKTFHFDPTFLHLNPSKTTLKNENEREV